MTSDKKKTIKTACLGADIYLFSMLVIGIILLAPVYLKQYFSPESNIQLTSWEGVASMLSVIVSSIILWCFALRQHKKGHIFSEAKSVKSAIFEKNKKMTPLLLLLFALVILFVQLMVEQVFNGMEHGLNALGYTAMASQAATSNSTDAITTLIYAALVGPATEEFVFRGFILKSFKPFGKVFAIVVSSLMFGLTHADIYQLLATLVAGVILGYVAMEYSIYASFLLHVINNVLFSAGLGELESINPQAAKILYIILGIAGFVALVYLLIKSRTFVGEYIRSNRARKGTWISLCNIWFILFIVFLIGQTIRSIKPL